MASILAVETATQACSAALLRDGECREILRLEANRHAELLIPMIRELLEESGCRFDQLDCLAFGSGPGSFTGLRIGISAVQGLALGLGLPVVPVSSLLALAVRVNAGHVLAAFDARMDQVYWNAYRRGPGGALEAIGEPRVDAPETVRLEAGGPWLAAGSGCDAHGDRMFEGERDRVELISGVHPHAGDIARLAEAEFLAGRAMEARDVAPEYVRNRIVQGG